MNLSLHKISLYLLYLLPISLITGPAIPDISISLICILFLIHTFHYKEYGWVKESWIKIGILFWLSLIFISFFADNKFLSFVDSIIFIRFILFSIAVYAWLIQSRKQLKILLIIIFLTLIFIIMDSLLQFLRYNTASGFGKDIFGFIPEHYGRLTGPFNKEHVPGSHLSKFFFISILPFIYLFKKNIKTSITLFVYIIATGFIIFVSGEKMAFLTFLLGYFIFIMIIKEYRKLFVLSFCSLIILITLLLQTHQSYNDYEIIETQPHHLGLKINKQFSCKDNTAIECSKLIEVQPQFLSVITEFNESVYYKIYLSAYRMWLDNKITGIGLNNYENLCEKNIKYQTIKKNYSNCSSHPHNYYLQWLSESGIIGFFFYILFVALIFSKLFFNINYTEAKIGLISLIIIFWPIMSTGSLLKNWNGIQTFFVIGLAILLSKKILNDPDVNS